MTCFRSHRVSNATVSHPKLTSNKPDPNIHMLFHHHFKTIVFIALLPAVIVAEEANWNQFRGPEGDGISSAADLPAEFDEASNVRWKTAIANQGWSSPVVWDDEIWVTTGSDDQQELRALCVDCLLYTSPSPRD